MAAYADQLGVNGSNMYSSSAAATSVRNTYFNCHPLPPPPPQKDINYVLVYIVIIIIVFNSFSFIIAGFLLLQHVCPHWNDNLLSRCSVCAQVVYSW